MRKLLLVILLVFTLSGCTFLQTTTEKNLAQLSDEDLANIKTQIMNELREEILNEYNNQITETENMIINVVKTYSNAVLGVSNFKLSKGQYIEASSGSGVIYKKNSETNEYYMITNEHVIDDADKIQVVLADNTYINAELIGADRMTDLAVIKFQTSTSLQTAVFGDSASLQVGQFAIAIGNPLGYDYYGSVTSGIVSGLARNIEIDYDNNNVIDWVATLIQHDAAISPGNSGGGLFDITGKLIGINNMKIVQDTVSDIGFAIPVNTVKFVVEQLETKGEVERASLGIEGMGVKEIIEINALIDAGYIGEKINLPAGVTTGVYISRIVPNSSAANSDLKAGDIILKYNDVNIITFDDLRGQIDIAKVGDTVTLTVNRNNSEIQITMTLIKRPE